MGGAFVGLADDYSAVYWNPAGITQIKGMEVTIEGHDVVSLASREGFVAYYGYGALGTDRYPPFSLQPVEDYPADLQVAYSEELSHWMPLVKWLLAAPHYMVLAVFFGGHQWGGPGGWHEGWRAAAWSTAGSGCSARPTAWTWAPPSSDSARSNPPSSGSRVRRAPPRRQATIVLVPCRPRNCLLPRDSLAVGRPWQRESILGIPRRHCRGEFV